VEGNMRERNPIDQAHLEFIVFITAIESLLIKKNILTQKEILKERKEVRPTVLKLFKEKEDKEMAEFEKKYPGMNAFLEKIF
jgi:hypothetical protein